MGKPIIALAGYIGSGKSTIANRLVSNHGFQLVKFAHPLKNMLRCLGLDDRHLEGELKTVPCSLLGGKTPRHAMQTLGTEWGRRLISDTLWTDAWKNEATRSRAEGVPVVCDDLRFPNELELLREIGGEVWFIKRGSIEKATHESESYMEALELCADRVFINDGSVESLFNQVDAAVQKVPV